MHGHSNRRSLTGACAGTRKPGAALDSRHSATGVHARPDKLRLSGMTNTGIANDDFAHAEETASISIGGGRTSKNVNLGSRSANLEA
jgi:hypothetical protein